MTHQHDSTNRNNLIIVTLGHIKLFHRLIIWLRIAIRWWLGGIFRIKVNSDDNISDSPAEKICISKRSKLNITRWDSISFSINDEVWNLRGIHHDWWGAKANNSLRHAIDTWSWLGLKPPGCMPEGMLSLLSSATTSIRERPQYPSLSLIQLIKKWIFLLARLIICQGVLYRPLP